MSRENRRENTEDISPDETKEIDQFLDAVAEEPQDDSGEMNEAEPPEATPAFEDSRWNEAYEAYQKNPIQTIEDINKEIENLENIAEPAAQEAIDFWLDVQDRLLNKYVELNSAKVDVFDPKLSAEDRITAFRRNAEEKPSKPEANIFDPKLSTEDRIALWEAGKKQAPQASENKLSIQERKDLWKGAAASKGDVFDPKLTPEQRIAMWKMEKARR